jgi:aminoglycoside 6'-N-acetyltransferase I
MPHVQFVPPRPEHTPALYAQYTRLTAGVPHCLELSEAAFAGQLLQAEAIDTLVAEGEQGQALGFAAHTHVTDDRDNSAQALTALWFDQLEVGTALLAECRQRAGQGDLLAFPAAHGRSPIRAYNAGWNGLSDRLASQGWLLARAGFRPYYRELHMICDMASQQHAPAEVAGVTIALAEEQGTFVQRASQGDQTLGVCEYYLLSRYTDSQRAARIGYVDGLWVRESARRHGIGRALMLHALAHQRSIGCEASWLTTGADNWPAQPLYLGLGFAFVDCSASFRRAAGASAADAP